MVVMRGILILFHCASNTGYAIEQLEKVFWEMAWIVTADLSKIHFGYKELSSFKPKNLPAYFTNYISFDTSTSSKQDIDNLCHYIKRNNIDTIFGFDLPLKRPFYKKVREVGIKTIIAYWGAPMSSLNGGLKLFLKQLEVAFSKDGPNHYIFESEAMRETAVYGRGIPNRKTSIVHLGVDVNRYRPRNCSKEYIQKELGIPTDKRIIFYSGHMEERKGIEVLINAAIELCNKKGRRDVHFVLCGNKNSEANKYISMYKGTVAQNHISFCGYRDDLPIIMASSYVGVIPSTGWDSFTMSSIEMAASGLPLIVSNFQGLKETVEQGVTGLVFTPSDHFQLASHIRTLIEDNELRDFLAVRARERVLEKFTQDRQVADLAEIVREVVLATG